MTAEEYISKQEPERREVLSAIHHIVLKTNKNIITEVAPMMRSEMIQYKLNNHFVYALASQKKYMSLHALPMYCCKPIHEKYSKLLNKASFQKGCINFKNAGEMPLDITELLLAECAKVDLVKMLKR